MPLSAVGSRRDPCCSQMPTETERTCCIGSVTTTRPFGKVDLWIGDGAVEVVTLYCDMGAKGK